MAASFTNTSAMFADTTNLTTDPTELRLYVTGNNLQNITKANTSLHLRYFLDSGAGGENAAFNYASYEVTSATSTRVDLRLFNLPVVAAKFQPTFNHNGMYVQNQFIATPSKPSTSIIAHSTLRLSVSVSNAYYVHGYEVYHATTNALITSVSKPDLTTVSTANSMASTTITTTAPVGTLYYVRAFNRLSGTSTNQYSVNSDVPITLSSITYSTTNTTTDTKSLKLKITGGNLLDSRVNSSNISINLRSYTSGGSQTLYAGWSTANYSWTATSANEIELTLINLPSATLSYMVTFLLTGSSSPGYVQNTMGTLFLTVPSAPTSVSVSGVVSGGATITATGSTAYSVTGYRAYNAANNALLGSSLTNSIPLTGLTNGTSYQVYVKAYGPQGESASSPISSVFVPGVTLSSITYSSVNTTTDTKTLKLKVTGTYLNNTDAVKSSTISINLRSYTSGGSQTLYSPWSPLNYSWTATSANEIELTLINLPSATLSYMVTFNLTGSGYVQNTMSTLFLTVPSAPTSVSVSGIVSGGATISATGSTAYSVTGYRAYNAANNALLGSSLNNSIPLTGLTNGTYYQVYVKAYGPQGESASSPTSTSFMTGMALSTISQVSTTSTSITLRITGAYLSSLTKPRTGVTVRSVNLSSGPSGYEGTLILDNGSEGWLNYTFLVISDSEVQITVNGLTSMIDYKITFIVGGVGYIQPDPAVDTLFKIGQPPSEPTNVAVSAGDTQAIVSFTAPEYDGGIAITRYNVYNASSNTLLSYGSSSPITIVGLTNGVSYQVYVKAVNPSGESDASQSSIAFMPISASGPPCFFGNAPVLTSSGYKRMDSIKVGDLVLSDKGEQVRVEHVEVTLCAASKQNNPFVIEKGQFGATERVLISPNHRVLTNGNMVKAKDLNLEREEMKGVLQYYNLQLENWSNMVVGGVKVESLAPVQHSIVSVPQLVSILQAKYGSETTTKEITNKVLRTCRLMADGRVEVPILRIK